MAGILLESGMVLVPVACAALYVIVTSNALLTIFLIVAAVTISAGMRLRYHYSSGAQTDLVITHDHPTAQASRQRSTSRSSNEADREEHEFRQTVNDARDHCSNAGNEIVRRSGPLLSEAVTCDSTKYDMELYGSALSYDHRCFYICGQPTWILAADFDYWRIPVAFAESEKMAGISEQAKDAWKRALQQLQSLGFNTVRIRFHWGFHSPSKGQYDFSGGRDVSALLDLCEQLGILVIACIGPFIGDDVQGGGYPFWLIQRDHIRLRHLWRSNVKVWDDQFAAAEAEWYDKISSMLAGHEVVVKNSHGRGCIMAVQLENHLSARNMLGLPLALHDETRLLARMARERVLRVPLVTNNLVWPSSFLSLTTRLWTTIEKKLRAYRLIKEPYHADISGFTIRDIAKDPIDMDSIARVTRGDNSPMLALELHGSHDKDGGSYSDQIETALGQGLSAFSLPSFFKRQCLGNLDSPLRASGADIVNSAVDEDGSLSADSRSSRLVLHAARALESLLAASDPVGSRPWILRARRPAVRGISVNKLSQAAVQVRRQWEYSSTAPSLKKSLYEPEQPVGVDENNQLGIVAFVDGRELPADSERELAFLFSLADAPISRTGSSFALTGTLGPRKRGIFAANLLVAESSALEPLVLAASSKEIYARLSLTQESEAWICAEESVQSGQLFFLGECTVSGHAEVEVVSVEHAKDSKFSFVIPKPGPGVFRVSSNAGVSVTVLLVDQQALDTLVVAYRTYNRITTLSNGSTQTALATAAAWGTDGISISGTNMVDILCPSDKSEIVVVSQQQPQLGSTKLLPNPNSDIHVTADLGQHDILWNYVVHSEQSEAITSVSGFERRTTSWDNLPWKLLPTMADLETMDEINIMSWQRDLGTFAYQAADLGFNASHVLYRCQVRLKPKHVTSRRILLQLNVRHRCTLWVNGTNMSGHQTFHVQHSRPGTVSSLVESMRNPGASAGADRWGGTFTFDVTNAMRLSSAEDEEGALNEVHIVVESFGAGTQANGNNDARTPRGLISAYWHGFNFVGEDHDDSEIHDHEHDKRTDQMRAKWEICGVDVTKMFNPYNSSGFPDETAQAGWTAAVEHPLVLPEWSTRVQLNVDAGVQWLRWQLPATKNDCQPVHLRIRGKAVVYVWVNGILLSKHRPSDSDSLVLLCGGCRGHAGSQDSVKLMMYGWMKDLDTNKNSIPIELSLVSSREGARHSKD
ncbi:hypothetical protein IWW42_003035 [Coemansia sp. RSA 1085]|nr:hypothetical protein IWW42_003035 [Coemansia sp. RSA 1085]